MKVDSFNFSIWLYKVFVEWCLEVYLMIFLLFIYSLIYVLFNIVQFWP